MMNISAEVYTYTGLQRPLFLKKGKTYDVKLIVDDTIAVLYINHVALSVRMYNKAGRGLSFSVTEGEIAVGDVTYKTNYK